MTHVKTRRCNFGKRLYMRVTLSTVLPIRFCHSSVMSGITTVGLKSAMKRNSVRLVYTGVVASHTLEVAEGADQRPCIKLNKYLRYLVRTCCASSRHLISEAPSSAFLLLTLIASISQSREQREVAKRYDAESRKPHSVGNTTHDWVLEAICNITINSHALRDKSCRAPPTPVCGLRARGSLALLSDSCYWTQENK